MDVVYIKTPGQNRHRGDLAAAAELARVEVQRRPTASQHSLRLRGVEEMARGGGRVRLRRGRGLRMDKPGDGVPRGPGWYRAPGKSLYVLLSRTQAGPGRKVKQGQEEISRNHVQTFICLSVNAKRTNN